MIYNMLDNSIKYNVSARKEIKLWIDQNNTNISVSIKDNGIGMNKKTTKNIFEKFYRGDNNPIHASGLGLGLFYVKQCLEAHGWAIEINSTEQVGCELIILIQNDQLK